MTQLDVHTEHCCIVHGCKYGDEDCPVTTGRKPQSYPCEDCDGVMPNDRAVASALPSVEPLPPGTRPTEPGWYVTGERQIVEVWHDARGSGVLLVAGIYWDGAMLVSETPEMTFIARIYPDRIGQE